jgi:hypothetical protein
MGLLITEEEKLRILNLYYLGEQNLSTMSYEDPESYIDKPTEDKSNEYPNYCLYPEFARKPTSTTVQGGASGEDLYIDGYCLYAQPKEASTDYGISGIWLPNTGDTKIAFWNQDKREKMYKKYKSYLDTVTTGKQLSYEDIKEQVDKLYIDGSVYAFSIDNVLYKPAITYASDYFRIAFAGFYVGGLPQSRNTKYKSPKWVDKRGGFEKLIDKYEDKISYAALAIGVALSAAFTGPFAIFIEIALELGVGIPLAIRAFQKGENTTGMFNLLGSLLPFLRLSKSFKGINEQVFDSLVSKLQRKESNLINAPSLTRARNFYHGLTNEEKKLLTKLLDEDEYGLWQLINKLQDPKKIKEIVIEDLRTVLKNNPSLLGKQTFWKTILGKELKVTGIFILTDVIYSSFFDWVLDAEDKEKLDGLELVIPENFKPDYYAMMSTKTQEDVKKLCKNGQVEVVTEIMMNSKGNKDAGIKMMNDLFQKPNINFEDRKPTISQSPEPTETVEELLSKGYVNILDLEGKPHNVNHSVYFPNTGDIYVKILESSSDTIPNINKIKKESILFKNKLL